MATYISNLAANMGAKLQSEIDLWGEYLGGDKWRDMRETINFQNPYIQGAMFIASFLPWGRMFKGLGMLSKLRKLGRGDGQPYAAGDLNLGRLRPSLPMSRAVKGTGNNSVLQLSLIRTAPISPWTRNSVSHPFPFLPQIPLRFGGE